MDIENKLEQQQSLAHLLQEKQFDPSLVQSVEAAGLVHPTVIQSKMLALYGERTHVLTREGFVSGKSTGNLLDATQHLISVKEQH